MLDRCEWRHGTRTCRKMSPPLFFPSHLAAITDGREHNKVGTPICGREMHYHEGHEERLDNEPFQAVLHNRLVEVLGSDC